MSTATTVLLDQQQVSSQTILDLYLHRPVTLMMLSFGQWFCLGAPVKDEALKNLEYSQGVIYVSNAGYDTLPHLEARLSNFNTFHEV